MSNLSHISAVATAFTAIASLSVTRDAAEVPYSIVELTTRNDSMALNVEISELNHSPDPVLGKSREPLTRWTSLVEDKFQKLARLEAKRALGSESIDELKFLVRERRRLTTVESDEVILARMNQRLKGLQLRRVVEEYANSGLRSFGAAHQT